jgi:hypothetical protein
MCSERKPVTAIMIVKKKDAKLYDEMKITNKCTFSELSCEM